MIRLIQFLNEKNHFLEKFYALNEAQIARLEAGLFDQVEKFYNQREDLLNIIKYIDAEVQKAHGLHKEMSGQYNEEQKAEIRNALRTKEAYVKRILEQDLLVLGLIDDAKSQIIRELKDVTKARKALNGYKASVA
ncbi:MAG: hypothetical protein ACXVAX_09500 [Pseudobdellovibrio sp.]